MSLKNIAIVTSTRADFNYFRLIIKKILKSDYLKLTLLVTGTHLLEKFGHTLKYIENENIPMSKTIEMYDENDLTNESLGKAIGRGVINFTKAFNELKLDMLLVLGDRYEPLASVIAASTLNIPIAHIHGGDSVPHGQIDEQIRHAITRFAHLHFPATLKSASIIKLLGEEQWRIHMVGSPNLDHLVVKEFSSREEISQSLGLTKEIMIVICTFHSYIFKPVKAGEYIKIILDVLNELELQTVLIYPNNDIGCNLIIKEIKNDKNNKRFKIFKNLNYFDYYSLMKNADLMIGNSSSGLIESPIFKLPVVNIGNRNRGRETTENVINVNFDKDEIKQAINKALSSEFKEICERVKNPYGDGNASGRIIEILEELKINKSLLIKKLTYQV